MRPRLLDLFSGAGGSAVGYSRAGFDITGVDIEPQPHYPFEFVQADALEYLVAHGEAFDVIHASPPCQAHSALRFRWGDREYPDLVAATRAALGDVAQPYVIENVMQAPLWNSLVLCGSMFGLKVIRHRKFETSPPIWFPPTPCQHPRNAVGQRGHLGDREWMTVTGHFSNMKKAGAAMGIEWMNQAELAQAIPPAYTQWLGRQLWPAMASPAWVPCDGCEDFYCRIHEVHAYDCDCPSIEEWDEDPYSDGGPALPAALPAGPDRVEAG